MSRENAERIVYKKHFNKSVDKKKEDEDVGESLWDD